MSGAALHALAQAAGVLVDWEDAASQPQRVGPDTLRAVLSALQLPADSEAQCRQSLRDLQQVQAEPKLLTAVPGARVEVAGGPGERYRLIHEDGQTHEGVFDAQGALQAPDTTGYWTLEDDHGTRTVAVAPPRCFGIADLTGEPTPRSWGVALQVYSARGADDAGIGDAQGALEWAQRIAACGGDALALSPVHAARPLHGPYSPYSPSDRRFFDPLHAAPALLLGRAQARHGLQLAGLGELAQALGDATLVDWRASSSLRWQWLQTLYARRDTLGAALHEDLQQFARDGDGALQAYCAFAANDFGDGNPDLHLFAQWLATRSWQLVQARSREAGLRIGLIADLAVGFDPLGAEAAAWPQAVLHGLELGAPPDAFNADGQVWGITGYSPTGLVQTGFAPFIELLRAVMRDRGGVRIDHILGLLRLWTVPRGAQQGEGAYLRYPLQDLLRLLAIESWRHRAIVIGEDLGVVPPGIREELSRQGVMGMDVLMFTRDRDGRFLPPSQWRADAVAMTTTHDLPTLLGWRGSVDIAWRQRMGLLKPGQHDADVAARDADVAALVEAVDAVGLDLPDTPAAWRTFTAASPAPLALLPAEDAMQLEEQPNLPGTVEGHPNWRRRLPDIAGDDGLDARLATFHRARHRPLDQDA
jgi:4-alpha-glucanotransferase